MTDREHALRILERIASQKLNAYEALAREPGIVRPDFVRTLVYGVLRWQARLDHAISQLAKRKLSRIDPLALQILRLGALQIWFSEVPAYAAVSESTDLAERLIRRAKSFVNAVLRRASECSIESLDPTGPSAREISIRTSHPEWLVERWVKTFGAKRSEAIAAADQEHSFPDVLVNVLKWTRADALTAIRERELEAEESPFVETMIRLRSATGPLGDLIRDGKLYPMDEGSAAVTRLLPETGGTVLDLCAAPGGKSLSLLGTGRVVVSADVSFSRLTTLRQSSKRFLGAPSRIVSTDALQPGLRGRFQCVLVDAPCSATGTIRKNPEVRWRVSEEEIQRMARRQKAILDRALDLSARYVLWVTCSLEPEENDDVVDDVLARRGDFRVCQLDPFTPLALSRWLDSGTLRLTPESGTDGFTALLLERKS